MLKHHKIFGLVIMFRDSKAQVSVEYLLTIIFAIILVVIVTVFALNLGELGKVATDRISEYKTKYFQKLFN